MKENQQQGIRLNKYLSDAGVCSRREADAYIKAGRVFVDEKKGEMGMRVTKEQQVFVDGKKIQKEGAVLLAFYKPKGIICTTSKEEPDNIVDFVHYEKRIYPIGRLDKDSEGLILLTNQGELVDKILRGSNQYEKEYLVTVNKKITSEFLRGMMKGVPITVEDKKHIPHLVTTRPCKIKKVDNNTFQIILTQGLNRQIRKMCEYFEYKVISLKRVRIMNISLGRLNCGTYRKVTEQEKKQLFEQL